MKKKLFLLEDDESLGEILSERLAKEGFEVYWAHSIKTAIEKIKVDSQWDLALLDVGLPDGNGFSFSEELQKINFRVPFIFLTAQSDAENRLKGYELGAHEYIPKPFHLKELLLRLSRVLKEYEAADIYKLEFSEVRVSELIVVNIKTSQKHVLSATEMKLLELLIKNSPKVVHRDHVMDSIWGEDKDLSHRTIDNMIVKLRTSLGNDGAKLKTIRGIGYQFIQNSV